ncbi:MAG: hypothetical protein AAF865_17220, partial [Pseudomonadota bacterium]
LMLPRVVQNHANGTLAQFGGELVRRLARDAPSYSGVGASGKPDAVQTHIYGQAWPEGSRALEQKKD